MRSLQAQITPARAAVVAALATVAAGGAPPLVGLYVVTVAVAVMLGAAFAAYLSVVDEPGEWAAFEVAACAVAALLTLAGATLRYPTIVRTYALIDLLLLARTSGDRFQREAVLHRTQRSRRGRRQFGQSRRQFAALEHLLVAVRVQ